MEKERIDMPLIQVAVLVTIIVLLFVTNAMTAYTGISEMLGENATQISTSMLHNLIIATIVVVAILVIPATSSIFDNGVKGWALGIITALMVAAWINQKYYSSITPAGKMFNFFANVFLAVVMIIGINRTSKPMQISTNYMLFGSHLGISFYQLSASASRVGFKAPNFDWIPDKFQNHKTILFIVIFIAMIFYEAWLEENKKFATLKRFQIFGYTGIFTLAFFIFAASASQTHEEVFCSVLLTCTSGWTGAVYFFDWKDEDMPTRRAARAIG